MGDLTIRCPAGERVDPPGDGPSCRCGVIRLDNARDPLSQGAPEVVTSREDFGSLHAFCAGRGQPGSGAEQALVAEEELPFGLELGAVVSFTACPVWRAEVERIEEHRQAARLESGVPRARPRGVLPGLSDDPFTLGDRFLLEQAIAQSNLRVEDQKRVFAGAAQGRR